MALYEYRFYKGFEDFGDVKAFFTWNTFDFDFMPGARFEVTIY